MRKLYNKNNLEVFQGKKCLTRNDDYFEGWYFKNIGVNEGISFIPGISINEKEKISFIQVITKDNSWFIDYDIEEFEYNDDPFWIRVGKSYFSKERVHIDIEDKELDLVVKGDLKYRNNVCLKKEIMGIFSRIPFMECKHSILCMKNSVDGIVFINDKKMEIFNGNGYIEKDFGKSFPKYYIWGEGNCFEDKDCSFFVSVADIFFKIFSFKGFICSLMLKNKEYRFASYNNSKILKYEVNDNGYELVLKKGKYILEIEAYSEDGFMLKAPVNGKMDKEILETISGCIKVILKKNNKVMFLDDCNNCGIEIVKES